MADARTYELGATLLPLIVESWICMLREHVPVIFILGNYWMWGERNPRLFLEVVTRIILETLPGFISVSVLKQWIQSSRSGKIPATCAKDEMMLVISGSVEGRTWTNQDHICASMRMIKKVDLAVKVFIKYFDKKLEFYTYHHFYSHCSLVHLNLFWKDIYKYKLNLKQF
jgi:hypothetical protein